MLNEKTLSIEFVCSFWDEEVFEESDDEEDEHSTRTIRKKHYSLADILITRTVQHPENEGSLNEEIKVNNLPSGEKPIVIMITLIYI